MRQNKMRRDTEPTQSAEYRRGTEPAALAEYSRILLQSLENALFSRDFLLPLKKFRLPAFFAIFSNLIMDSSHLGSTKRLPRADRRFFLAHPDTISGKFSLFSVEIGLIQCYNFQNKYCPPRRRRARKRNGSIVFPSFEYWRMHFL